MSRPVHRVEVDSRRTLLDGFFRVDEVVLRHQRLDGSMSAPLTRLELDRGDGAAVVLHDPGRDRVILVRQFRFPAWEKGPGWMLELVAGVVGEGEAPEEVARREALEETGYRLQELEPVATFYLSPGGCSERIFLFYARVCQADRRHEGGGLVAEGEDLEVVEMSLEEAWRAVDEGAIADAKTLVGLLCLRRRVAPDC